MNLPGFEALQTRLAELTQQGLKRQLVVAQTPCQPEVQVNGQTRLAFNSNDYLGLANHPKLVEALQEGARRYGVGSGASHLISGHSLAHAQLEERLAQTQSQHIPNARALYLCTGFMANLAVITALVDIDREHCMVFSESLNHASLIDGIRLSRAPYQLYPHCDVQALEKLLSESTARHKMVITDSVFSMDGDIAPLKQTLALCEKYQAWLVVDDAHGFGVLGEQGHGALQAFDLRSDHLVYMGTLGKAAGVGGAFVAAHTDVIEWMIQRARPYIYTTAAPPALAHALLASLDLIEGNEGLERRRHLARLIETFANDASLNHLHRLASSTAVQPVILGSNAHVLEAAASLQAQGLWVTAIRAPTVPVGTARLRLTLSAGHTMAQLERLIAALSELQVAGVERVPL
jgi:8-amino-7-oxononanoate synthase